MMLIYDRSYDFILTGIRIVPVFQAVQMRFSLFSLYHQVFIVSRPDKTIFIPHGTFSNILSNNALNMYRVASRKSFSFEK